MSLPYSNNECPCSPLYFHNLFTGRILRSAVRFLLPKKWFWQIIFAYWCFSKHQYLQRAIKTYYYSFSEEEFRNKTQSLTKKSCKWHCYWGKVSKMPGIIKIQRCCHCAVFKKRGFFFCMNENGMTIYSDMLKLWYFYIFSNIMLSAVMTRKTSWCTWRNLYDRCLEKYLADTKDLKRIFLFPLGEVLIETEKSHNVEG